MNAKPTYEELEHRISELEKTGLEQMRAEADLRRSEENVKKFVENLNDVLYAVDAKGTITYVSRPIEPTLGFTPAELVGKRFSDLVHPDDRAPIHRAYEEVLQGRLAPREYRIRTRDGAYRWIRTSSRPVRDKEQIIGLQGVLTDITERKIAEEQLKRKNAELVAKQRELAVNEALFRGLFDNMTSGSAIYEVINDGTKGADYIVKGFNRKSLEIEGKSLDQVMGKSLFDLRPTIDDYGLIPVMKQVWETGIPAFFPVKIYRDENFSNYYENYVFKIPSGEIVTIYNDVTEQKNAEIALKESQERFELAMHFSNDGLFDWNLENNRIYYSPGWKKMLGYEDHEIDNQFSEWERLTRPEDVKASWEMMNALLEGKTDRFEMEFRMRHKNGDWVDILSRANVVHDESGKGVRVVGTHTDITGRKRLESLLHQSRKMESIGTLAGGIAHDFNNILASILGYAELAIEDVNKGSVIENDLREIFTAAKRARDLVKQILTFARKSDETLKPIPVEPIAREVLKFIKSSIPATIEIKQQIHSDALITGNETQVHQILMNLCTNAAHAMENQGGILEVGLTDIVIDNNSLLSRAGLHSGNYVELSVSDTGIGIPPELIGSIFDPYFTTKGPGKGTGMGLAVVLGIVESYGGKITVKSECGQGTAYKIYLPATRAHKTQRPDQPATLPRGTERILFVDDEEPITQISSLILNRLGYSVTTKTGSVEALELFRSKPTDFDLVITDMTMPNLTGDKLAVELMTIRPDIPVILCTGYSNVVSDERAAEIGIKAFVTKPVSKKDFAETVRNVLDQTKDAICE